MSLLPEFFPGDVTLVMISFFCSAIGNRIYSMICASQEALKKLCGNWLFPFWTSLSRFAPETSALIAANGAEDNCRECLSGSLKSNAGFAPPSFPGHALHEKGLQKHIGVGTLVNQLFCSSVGFT